VAFDLTRIACCHNISCHIALANVISWDIAYNIKGQIYSVLANRKYNKFIG